MLKLNKHIHFDDQSSTSSSSSEAETDTIRNDTSNNNQPKIFKLKLIKHDLENSFGFQVSGDLNEGQHYVDSIVAGSPAHQAGLSNYDKIITINKVNVEHFNVEKLIKQLEKETKKNSTQLNLSVARKMNSKIRNNDNAAQSLKFHNSDLFKTYTNLKRRIITFCEDEDNDEEQEKSENNKESLAKYSKVMPKFTKQKKTIDSPSNDNDSKNQFTNTSLVNVFKAASTPTISYYSGNSLNEIPSLLSLPVTYPISSNHQMSPAFLIEQSYDNSFPTINDSAEPVKTLSEIRHEKIEHIKFISPQRPFKRPNVPTKTILDVRAREIQRRLSEQGKYVIWQEIIYELLNLYEGCQHIGDLGLSQADHLQTINELIWLQKRIDTFLIAYESRLPCVTLIELEHSICNDYNYAISNNSFNNNNTKSKITKYEELFVGPMIRNQIIRKIFSLTEEIKSIEQMKPIKLINLLKHLENYLNEKDLWHSKKIKQEDFEVYLLSKHKVISTAILGVKINNIGMLVGSIKNVQYCYSQSLNEVKKKLTDDWDKSLEQEKKFLLKNLSERFQMMKTNDSSYLNKNSFDLITDLLLLFEKFFSKTELNNISSFLKVVQQTSYLRDCLQLAICFGKNDLDLVLAQMRHNKSNDISYNSNNLTYYSFLKRVFNLVIDKNSSGREIKRFLNEILTDKSLKIVSSKSHIKFADDSDDNQDSVRSQNDCNETQTEIQIGNQLNQDSFSELIRSKYEPFFTLKFEHLIKMEQELWNPQNNNETFLNFLNRNKQIFEQLNLSISLIGENNQNNESLKLKRSDLIQHIKQIMNNNTKDLNIIEKIICKYFKVTAFNQLGFSCSFKDLLSSIQTTDNHDVNVIYLNSIINSSNVKVTDFSVKENQKLLVNKLLECPLLDRIDYFLEEYFNLDGIDLKQLINNLNSQKILLENNEHFVIDLLETEPGVLLKLTRNTDIDLLKQAIENGDFINAIGHLVSLMAIKYKSLKHMPRSLMINEIESSMSFYLNKCVHDQEENKFYSFLIELIYRLPIKLIINANQLLFDYVIGPVAKIENDNQIKKKLFQYLIHSRQSHIIEIDERISHFVKLGRLCTINEWSWENCFSINQATSSIKTTKNLFSENMKINLILDDKKIEKPKNLNDDEIISKPFEPELNQTLQATCEIIETSNIENNQSIEFEHVLSIRKKFGIDIKLDESTKSVTDHVKSVLGRSLETVSNELYNKDMHFVLELIQNADDNKYESSEKFEPSLIFLIEKDCITLFNNEVGFNQQHINAICDVKASTKGKHQRGYIGRKGIGFKSVFTVTDRPEIHSNGYHIKFDLNNGHIGYILPSWIGESRTIKSSYEFVNNKIFNLTNSDSNLNMIGKLNTCIQLPLKSESEMQRHKSSLLTNNFNDIKSYLLLFLNRLKYIILIQKTNEDLCKEKVFYRNDISENLIEIKSIYFESIKCVHSKQKWLVVKENLTVPKNLKPNDSVESTDLCLAFPMDNQRHEKMDVFAYLPLRSFGFHFIIQADFVVPASRQDITEDSEWNQWIVKQLPRLFIKSFDYFKQHKEFNNNLIEALSAYLSFIPLEEEIVGFFQHVPRQIIDLLRNEPFLPAIDVNNKIVWKKPFECLILKESDDIIRQVLTSDMLKKHLGRYYLDSSLHKINSNLLTRLGVHYLSIADLIGVLESVFDLNKTDKLKDVKSTAKWLIILQHCLKSGLSIQQEENFICQLKSLSFIPIISCNHEKQLVSLDKCVVFFSFSVDKKTKNKSKIELEIESDLNLLDSDALLCLDELQNQQIITVLKMLGVKTIQPREIIEDHILPVLSSKQKLENKSEQTLILYLVYLQKFFHNSIIDLNVLKPFLLIKTNKGFMTSKNVNLTPQYGNKYDLKKLLPSYDWCLVDTVYLTKSMECIGIKNKQEENQILLNWRRFFISIGINDVFTPSVNQSQLKMSDLNKSTYSEYSDLLKVITNDEYYQFNDYNCEIFDYYKQQIQNGFTNKLGDELANLFRIIEENWEQSSYTGKPLSSFKYVSVNIVSLNKSNQFVQSTRTPYTKENLCESEYFKRLKSTNWILVECNRFQENKMNLELSSKINLEKPCNVFVKEQIFTRYYGLLVPYACNQPNKNNSNLSKEIGFKFEFDKHDFMRTFEKWIRPEIDESISIYMSEPVQVNFNASILQMRNIYKLFNSYLNSFETDKDIYNHLNSMIETKQAFLFVPNEMDTRTRHADFIEKVLAGKFYSNDQVYWSDPNGLFNKYKSTNLKNAPILLEPIYGDKMRQTFVESFGLNETPNLIDYINLLDHIASLAATNSSKFTFNEILKDVYTLYEVIVDKCIEMSRVDFEVNNFIDDSSISIEISDSVKIHLLEQIKYKWIIPCYNNKWLSLVSKNEKTGELIYNNPILVDNTELAEKFIEKFDMVVMPLVEETTLIDPSFSDFCRLDSSLNMKRAFFLINLLELKLFSKTVILDLENITENLRESSMAQNICSKLVPFIQCFLCYRTEFKQIYQELNSDSIKINEKLNNMKFYSVRELQNIYRCTHDPSISVIVSNKSCFETNEKAMYWKYFIRADILENEKDIIKGFVKLFVKNGLGSSQSLINERNEKELTNFVLLMHQFVNSNMIAEDIRDIEKEYKLKLVLPPNEIKWSIKEITVSKPDIITINQNDSTVDKDLLTKKFKPTNQQINQRLVYEQLSRNQINIPLTNDNNSILNFGMVNYPNETVPSILKNNQKSKDSFLVTNQQMSALENNVATLANQMSTNFNIENVNQTVLNSNGDIKAFKLQDSLEWSQLIVNNFKSLVAHDSLSSKVTTNYMSKIGRWGEIWVNEMLKKQFEYELSCDLVKIEWMNENNESGLPYDFRISFKKSNEVVPLTDERSQNGHRFIEVKSTTKSCQEAFPISYKELIFAQNYSSQFQIYRLYNAGTDDPKCVEIKIIEDIPNLLNSHQINLFIVI